MKGCINETPHLCVPLASGNPVLDILQIPSAELWNRRAGGGVGRGWGGDHTDEVKSWPGKADLSPLPWK